MAPIRIIAGSGRSGTTWVQDVLAEANALRPVYEPLHPLALPQASAFAYRYFRPAQAQPDAHAYLASVFAGSMHGWWTDYRVRPDRLRPHLGTMGSLSALHVYLRRWRKLYRQYRRYRVAMRRPTPLVKFIRANLLLGWLRAQFDARIVLVLRHPGAVVESRLRLGGDDWAPQEQLQLYIAQSDLQEDYLFKYNHVLRGPLSDVEAHTAIWCIENQLPLTQLQSGEVTVAYYEELLSGPGAPWLAVLHALELSQMPAPELLLAPSQSASRARTEAYDRADRERWHARLSPAVRAAIGNVLRAMGVVVYDIDDPWPRPAPEHGSAGQPTPVDLR